MKWRKSTRTSDNGGTCVEVARVPGAGHIATRDSKQPTGPRLTFDVPTWNQFLTDVKKGKFDLG